MRPIRSGRCRRIPLRMLPSALPAEPNRDPGVSLLARIARGDESALGELFDAVAPRVLGLCRRILRDPGASEEATLDVFHQVWRQAGSYDPSRGSPVSWILLLARTRAIDLLRARTRRTGPEASIDEASGQADPTPDPEAQARTSLRAARVRSALALLSPDQRAAIEKAFFEGMSHSEVAESLGAPLGTVKTRIRTGLEIIRLALAAEEGVA